MPQFKKERVSLVLLENLNPSLFLLNLNPNTASRANKDDITTPVVTWLSVGVIIILAFSIFKMKGRFVN